MISPRNGVDEVAPALQWRHVPPVPRLGLPLHVPPPTPPSQSPRSPRSPRRRLTPRPNVPQSRAMQAAMNDSESSTLSRGDLGSADSGWSMGRIPSLRMPPPPLEEDEWDEHSSPIPIPPRGATAARASSPNVSVHGDNWRWNSPDGRADGDFFLAPPPMDVKRPTPIPIPAPEPSSLEKPRSDSLSRMPRRGDSKTQSDSVLATPAYRRSESSSDDEAISISPAVDQFDFDRYCADDTAYWRRLQAETNGGEWTPPGTPGRTPSPITAMTEQHTRDRRRKKRAVFRRWASGGAIGAAFRRLSLSSSKQ